MAKWMQQPSTVYSMLAVSIVLTITGIALAILPPSAKLRIAIAIILGLALVIGIHPSFEARMLKMPTWVAVSGDLTVTTCVATFITLLAMHK